MSAENLRYVPLPEVDKYTDSLVFGNLGLPVGFDQERLLVNVPGINRIQKVAGLGMLSIIGYRGEREPDTYQISGVSHSGIATFGGMFKSDKADLSDVEVDFPRSVSIIDKPDIKIKVNGAEIQERITEKPDKYPRGVFDPNAQAKYLNKSLKAGLYKANAHANVNSAKAIETLRIYGIFIGTGLYSGVELSTIIPLTFLVSPAYFQISRSMDAAIALKKIDPLDDTRYRDVLKSMRKSLFAGATLDRAIGGNVLTATTKFVKAQK